MIKDVVMAEDLEETVCVPLKHVISNDLQWTRKSLELYV